MFRARVRVWTVFAWVAGRVPGRVRRPHPEDGSNCDPQGEEEKKHLMVLLAAVVQLNLEILLTSQGGGLRSDAEHVEPY